MAVDEGQQPASEAADGAMEACTAAKARGNEAYSSGDLGLAVDCYSEALDLWEKAVDALPQAKVFKVGELVRYDARNYFGMVMSAFTMFDEYFLKDLGSDKAIWVGQEGGDLRRFARTELLSVTQDLLDLRLAVAQNLAAVRLKQGEFTEAVRWADAALVISGRAPKALMRKGAALLKLNRPGPASDVLATAAEVTPADIEVSRLLREAEARRSPTWVCATGCCGPWGIVCGGDVATTSTQAQVVAPAKRQVADEAESAQEGAEALQPEAAAAAADVDPAEPQPDTARPSSPSGVGAEARPAEQAASDAPAAERSQQVDGAQGKDAAAWECAACADRCHREECAAAAAAAAATAARGRKGSGLVSLASSARHLWMGTASMLVAAVAAAWMIGEAGSGYAAA